MKKCLISLACYLASFNLFGQITPEYGVHWANALVDISGQELRKGADSLKAHNIKWLRVYFEWNKIQPTDSQWDWGTIDAKTDSLVNNGFHIIGTFINTPQWASSNPDTVNYPQLSKRYPPKDTADWKNYIDSVVSRYHHQIEHWEVWNEPNAGIYFITENIIDKPYIYYTLLKIAYNTVKNIDTSNKVLIGGLTTETFIKEKSILFLDSIFKLGAFNYYDIMNLHLYQNIAGLKQGYDSLYNAWEINKKPVWITETNNALALRPENSEQNSANNICSWLKDSIIACFNPEVICWFYMQNWARDSIFGVPCDTCDTNKTFFGLFDTDYEPTLLLDEFAHCDFTTTAYPSVKNNGQFHIFPNPAKNTVNIFGNNLEQIEIYNIYGHRVFIKQYNQVNQVKIDISRLSGRIYFIKTRSANNISVVQIVKH